MGLTVGDGAPSRRRLAIRLAIVVLTVAAAAADADARSEPSPPPSAAGQVASETRARAVADTAVADTAGTATGPPQQAPFQALPVGPPPVSVPYAIGTRVFFAGRGADLADRFEAAFPGRTLTPEQRQFTSVTGGDGYAWTDIVALGSDVPAPTPGARTDTVGPGTDTVGPGTDTVHVVGRMAADGSYTPFHVSTGGSTGPAVTTDGLVVMPGSGQAYTAAGAYDAALTGSQTIDCGWCDPTAAGPQVVIHQSGDGSPRRYAGTWLWDPPDSIAQLGDGLRAVGRLGPGWLGQRGPDGCWRVAPASAPNRLGAPLCSLTTPLVSADGRRAVVVQAGRLLVLDPVTGSTVSTASMAAISGWAPPTAADPAPAHPRYAVPAAWESDDDYLVTARFDAALALVRCSASTGACRRVVWSTVRPGVDAIVTERGPADAQ